MTGLERGGGWGSGARGVRVPSVPLRSAVRRDCLTARRPRPPCNSLQGRAAAGKCSDSEQFGSASETGRASKKHSAPSDGA